MLGTGEGIDNPVNGIHGSFGMQCSDDYMSGLHSSHGRVDGLGVPHFSQQDHMRCLSDTGPESRPVIPGVDGDFTLADDALLMPMEKLDRGFQRHNMAPASHRGLVPVS